MKMTIDLRNYRDTQGARVPEGTYLVRLDALEEGESREKNPMLIAYYTIIGGEQDGLALVDRMALSEKAMFRVVAFLNGFGIKTPRKQLTFDSSRLINRRVQVEVVDNEWNGRTSSQIASYMRLAKQPDAETAGSELEEVDLEEETVVEQPKAAPAKSSPAAAPKTTAETVSEHDEDELEEEEAETSNDTELDLDDIDI